MCRDLSSICARPDPMGTVRPTVTVVGDEVIDRRKRSVMNGAAVNVFDHLASTCVEVKTDQSRMRSRIERVDRELRKEDVLTVGIDRWMIVVRFSKRQLPQGSAIGL